MVDCFAEQRRLGPTGTRLDVGTVELVELDCLTARLNEHRSSRETTPKGHIGWPREIDSQILYVEAQRERLVGYLTHQPLIGSNLGQTVAIMSMSSAWGMLVEI